jgi:EAL domain-containing protein (putative c-di-GMP-specific phosphodiesterase class I)
MQLLSALRQAIEKRQLQIVYQPQYDAHSEQLSGFEALLRWEHPQLGHVDTQEFITVAEQGGLIDELDFWALGQVCQQIKAWHSQGLSPPRVAVNMSGKTLHDKEFIATVSRTLQRHQIAREWVQLELTETALLPSFEGPDSTLNQIRALGLGIAVDDFGTGYSSLSYLRKLPITELKIDASFVRDIATNHDAATITETIFAMARSLDLEVVAEGVETAEQLAFLRNLGPLQIQGYYFSKALTADAAQSLLPTTDKTAALSDV